MRRAWSARLALVVAKVRRLRDQKSGGASVWKRAISVWASVRVALVAAPSALVSLTSAAYAALVRAGGPGARNCETPATTNGRIDAFSRPTGLLAARNWPGDV